MSSRHGNLMKFFFIFTFKLFDVFNFLPTFINYIPQTTAKALVEILPVREKSGNHVIS